MMGTIVGKQLPNSTGRSLHEIAFMIPFDRLIVRVWQPGAAAKSLNRAVFYREPGGLVHVLLDAYDKRTWAMQAYDMLQHPGAKTEHWLVDEETEHWLVDEDKTAGFLILYHQGMTAQALRLIGLEPTGDPW